MRKERKRGMQIGLGASSILMIFVVLCMMILCVLSYSRAAQSEKIALREKAYQEAYYRSDFAAEEIIDALRKGKDCQKLLDAYAVRITQKGKKQQLVLPVKDKQQLVIVCSSDYQIIYSWKLTKKGA